MESFTGSSFTKVHLLRLDRGEYLLENHERACSGHLENGCMVLYLCEIVIAEMEGFNFQRIKNKDGILELTNK